MDSSTNNVDGTLDPSLSDRITVKKFSSLIGKSYPTTQRIVENGHVEAIKIGSQWRISMAEVRRFLEFGNRVPPADNNHTKG